jgi:hypothetical protein
MEAGGTYGVDCFTNGRCPQICIPNLMTVIGLSIAAATVLVIAIEFLRRRRFPFPRYGWAGLLLLLAAEVLLFQRVWPVTIYFTPIAWTAYLLIVDAMIFAIRGRSRLHDSPTQLVWMATLSIPLWLIFEAYNLRLANWTYIGLPENTAARLLGYAWSFATITPAILLTAELVESFGRFKPSTPLRFSRTAHKAMIAFGAACLVLPLILPQRIAAYLFALVWVGFVFLLDPINHKLGLPSLLADLAAGYSGRFWSLFISGWVCGWLWEFWNYWAAAKWLYVFPIFQEWKIFEMPIPGYLGFLPFALECFVMYASASWGMKALTGREALHSAAPVPELERRLQQ